MKLSCNRLKKYIKDSESIDWLKIWDLFTIRTAEVEDVTVVGNSFDNVVIAEIKECIEHPNSDHMHILKVDCGEDELIQVVCGANNVRVGLKTAYIKVGGHINDTLISAKPLRGIMSNGMCCSVRELGIGDNHDGIIELPSNAKVGMDIHDYLPINDIIVEIDNKSLTNRPDLWGYYGIAREIAAITNHKLLDLDLLEVNNNKEDLNINVINKELCKRYSAIKVDNITSKNVSLEDQIFLHYIGLRSISLLVDLTNIIMVELGLPMHAFDSRKINNIVVDNAKNNDKFTTLDGVERILDENTLMIKDGDNYTAIAGIMGGLDSEIVSDTTSLVLESAVFDATCIRKSATRLGLRTDASSRYEKSLDPELTCIAIKRYLYLLNNIDNNINIVSNLTDIKNYEYKEKVVELPKKLLHTYIDEDISEDKVIEILSSLEFKVINESDKYIVTVPSYRATKDISLAVDLIEEVARMYGYENFTPRPLKIDVTFTEHEFDFTRMFEIKKFLVDRYSLNEVHSYLWYDDEFLRSNGIVKNNLRIKNKSENNILRDELSLSLLPIVKFNLKNFNNIGIFEIGTVCVNEQNKNNLSIILAGDQDNLESIYSKSKHIVVELFRHFKNKEVLFKDNVCSIYNRKEFSKEIICNNEVLGELNVTKTNIGKKKTCVQIEISMDKFLSMDNDIIEVKKISKYPTVSLDYTIITNNDIPYIDIDNIVKNFDNKYIKEYKLVDIYKQDNIIKYTINFLLTSYDKTLEEKDLKGFKTKFISYIKDNGLDILE